MPHPPNPATWALPPVIAVTLADIAESEAVIEFPDHSLAADYTDGGPWVTLADMHTDLASSNNCRAATHALDQALAEQIGTPPGVTCGTVVIAWTGQAGEPVHWANTLTLDGETWVIDYTARQFNAALPFPYVADLATWEQTVRAEVAREYGWTDAETIRH